jgi:hypothetical protein
VQLDFGIHHAGRADAELEGFEMSVILAILFALAPLFQTPVLPGPGPIHATAKSWTVINHTEIDLPTACNSSASCTFSFPAIGSGHFLVVVVLTSGSAYTPYSSITGGGGTWVNCTACYSTATNGSFDESSIIVYNFRPSAGTSSLGITLSAVGGGWAGEVIEGAWSGTTVAYDAGASVTSAQGCTGTACPGLSLSLSGSNDFIIQANQPFAHSLTAISGGAGYSAFADLEASYGGAVAGAIGTTNGAAPSFTDSGSGDSVTPSALALKGS